MELDELEAKLNDVEERQKLLQASQESFAAKTNRTVGDFASQPELVKKLVTVGDNIIDAIYRNKLAIDELRKYLQDLYIVDHQDIMIAKGDKTERFRLSVEPYKNSLTGCTINMYVNGLRYFQGKEFVYDSETNTVSWNNQAVSTADPGNGSPWEIAANSLVVFEYKIKAKKPQ